MRLRQLILCLVCGLMASCTGLLQERPLSGLERSMLVQASDFERYDYDFPDREKLEQFYKGELFDGTLYYEYSFEWDRNGAYYFFNHSISKFISEKQAESSFETEKLGLELATLAGADFAPQEGFLHYGDTSTFSLIVQDSLIAGNLFRFRKGSVVYDVFLLGIYFDLPRDWEAFIRPKISRFERVLGAVQKLR